MKFIFSVHYFTEAAERWKIIISSSIAGKLQYIIYILIIYNSNNINTYA